MKTVSNTLVRKARGIELLREAMKLLVLSPGERVVLEGVIKHNSLVSHSPKLDSAAEKKLHGDKKLKRNRGSSEDLRRIERARTEKDAQHKEEVHAKSKLPKTLFRLAGSFESKSR